MQGHDQPGKRSGWEQRREQGVFGKNKRQGAVQRELRLLLVRPNSPPDPQRDA